MNEAETSCPPRVSEADIKVLAVIARGHPDRKMTSTYNGRSVQVSALTWNEIQLGLNAPFKDISDSIACLVANDLIYSGRQQPSIWGRLKGETEVAFFWATNKGQMLLQSNDVVEVIKPDPRHSQFKSTPDDLSAVENFLRQLGYDITPFGAGIALLSLENGYRHVETAMHLALVALAMDCRAAGFEIQKSMALVAHAKAMMDILSQYRDAGDVRDELFKNDVGAMLKVVMIDKDQSIWIDRVLSDPILTGEPVATSRINYKTL